MKHTRLSVLLQAVLVLWAALVLGGCDCAGDQPPPGSEGAACATTASCNVGLVCRDGVCTVGVDGGAQDGGPLPTDGGPVCPTADRCGSGCCEGGQECVADACVPACAEPRCGAGVCCDAGQLCIADACVTPGDDCAEEIDCPLDAFCEPGLARCLPRLGAERCEFFPEPGVFEPEQQWAWTASAIEPTSVHVMMAPVVGDLDGDGVPEVVFNTYTALTSYGGAGVLRVVRGDTGVETVTVTSPVVCPMHGIALGDLDADGTPEIVTMLSPCGSGAIAAFSPDGTLLWQSHNADGSPFVGNFQFGAPSIADLEGDGRAEVVVGGAVLESDGTLRWSTREGAGSNCCPASSPLSTAYDVDGDGVLEVIAGNAVWTATGGVVWEDASLLDGYIAVADFYADGIPDVAVVHAGAVSIRRGTDGALLFGPVAMPGGGRGGPPTVADFDGDGLPEIGVAGGLAYAVFDPDGATPILWQSATQDGSSNVTGSSVFDFDGDGRAEVVYNDECYMRVYAGNDGTVLAQVPQHSHTLVEYPLIVDVDADGNAEIVFAGNAAVNQCASIAGYTGHQSGIRVFRDAADNWVGTRPVWNQHTYHATNVRRDLSIPAGEQPNWSRFNSFRQNPQSFDAPNLVPSDLSAVTLACPTTLELVARVRNDGAVSVGAGLPVSFYAGTPDGAARLLATVRTTERVVPGGSVLLTASVTPAAADLGRGLAWFVRVDDLGDGAGENNECVETDNVDVSVYDCVGIE